MAIDAARLKSTADSLLGKSVAAGDVPGVVAAVTTRDRTVYEAAFGNRVLGQGTAMTPDTVMWIASMTKPVTGVAAMQMVEQGRLALDEPAAKVLPELGRVKVLEGWDGDKPRLREPRSAITLRNLLTHTSGYAYDIWNPDMDKYLKRTERDRKQLFPMPRNPPNEITACATLPAPWSMTISLASPRASPVGLTTSVPMILKAAAAGRIPQVLSEKTGLNAMLD